MSRLLTINPITRKFIAIWPLLLTFTVLQYFSAYFNRFSVIFGSSQLVLNVWFIFFLNFISWIKNIYISIAKLIKFKFSSSSTWWLQWFLCTFYTSIAFTKLNFIILNRLMQINFIILILCLITAIITIVLYVTHCYLILFI